MTDLLFCCFPCVTEGDEGAAGHPAGQREGTHGGPAAPAKTTDGVEGTTVFQPCADLHPRQSERRMTALVAF